MADIQYYPLATMLAGSQTSGGVVQKVQVVTVDQQSGASSAASVGGAISDVSTIHDISTAQATLAAASGATSTTILALGAGQSSFVADLTGSFSAGSTITVDASPYTTGVTTEWFPLTFRVIGGSGAPVTSLVGTGGSQAIRGHVSGWAQIRVRASVLQGGDVITVNLRAGQGISEVTLQNPLDSSGNLKTSAFLGAQKSATDLLQSAVTATVALGASPTGTTDGYGNSVIDISNTSDGTAVVTVTGSLDSTFAVVQDALVLGVVKLADSTNGVNVSRSLLSGVITVAAHTTASYQVYDLASYVRAPLVLTGRTTGAVTVTLYKMAV